MKKTYYPYYSVCCFLLLSFMGWLLFCSFYQQKYWETKTAFTFPYQQAGMTTTEAAAHLLSRFTYGAKPGGLEQLERQGLENWFMQQLSAQVPDDSLQELLDSYDAINLSNATVVRIFPKPGQVVRKAIKEGVINQEDVNKDRSAYRQLLADYMQKNGFRPQQDLFRQFISQKVLRAAYGENQLQEVMTSFWLNHFNVSVTKGDCARFIPAYERDVIRPHALGKFGDLLLATAKSPAMQYYLDNFSSTGAKADTGKDNGKDQPKLARIRPLPVKKSGGLNENYAREVMELHTLGVDGGYSQHDVTEAARILTGWTVYPLDPDGAAAKRLDRASEAQLEKRGFKPEGDFLFSANRHDTGRKVVLGTTFGPDSNMMDGFDEGVRLLDMLAHHKSTAAFISRKIAVRFVSDNPPSSLISKMAKTFLEKDGDIRQVLITMVSAPEFWSRDAVREKTKSPFELAMSAVRNLDAEITRPYQLYSWISKMGEKMYYYQAPTGFPDKGQYWINTGSLLSRMNFGLAFASNRVPGVRADLAKLNNYHEPESSQAALKTYGKLIMPGRDLDRTIGRLYPLINDPSLSEKVEKATMVNKPAQTGVMGMQGAEMPIEEKPLKQKTRKRPQQAMGSPMLAQVVGIIIGSPEYQRR